MKQVTKDLIISWHRHGYETDYIARLLHITTGEAQREIDAWEYANKTKESTK